MAEQAQKGKVRRKTYVVDREMQGSVARLLLLTLAGVAGLYVAGLFLVPGSDSLSRETPEETRSLLLKVNAIYFGFAGAALTLVALLLTHRVAGPALVLRRAVEGMKEGDFGRRLSLRKHDYLKGLAASVLHLSGQIQEQARRRGLLRADLLRCLEERDLAAAREVVAQLAEQELRPAEAPAATGPAAVRAEPAETGC